MRPPVVPGAEAELRREALLPPMWVALSVIHQWGRTQPDPGEFYPTTAASPELLPDTFPPTTRLALRFHWCVLVNAELRASIVVLFFPLFD